MIWIVLCLLQWTQAAQASPLYGVASLVADIAPGPASSAPEWLIASSHPEYTLYWVASTTGSSFTQQVYGLFKNGTVQQLFEDSIQVDILQPLGDSLLVAGEEQLWVRQPNQAWTLMDNELDIAYISSYSGRPVVETSNYVYGLAEGRIWRSNGTSVDTQDEGVVNEGFYELRVYEDDSSGSALAAYRHGFDKTVLSLWHTESNRILDVKVPQKDAINDTVEPEVRTPHVALSAGAHPGIYFCAVDDPNTRDLFGSGDARLYCIDSSDITNASSVVSRLVSNQTGCSWLDTLGVPPGTPNQEPGVRIVMLTEGIDTTEVWIYTNNWDDNQSSMQQIGEFPSNIWAWTTVRYQGYLLFLNWYPVDEKFEEPSTKIYYANATSAGFLLDLGAVVNPRLLTETNDGRLLFLANLGDVTELFLFSDDLTSFEPVSIAWPNDTSALSTLAYDPGYFTIDGIVKAENGDLYFSANNGLTGQEVWRLTLSDEPVTDTDPASDEDSSSESELYAELIMDFTPGSESSFPTQFAVHHDMLFLSVGGLTGVYDGESLGILRTSTGIRPVPTNFASLGDDTLILAENGLFHFDGQRTELVTDQVDFNYELAAAIEFQGRVYSGCSVANHRAFQLWASDGTQEGTVSIANLTDPSPSLAEREKSSDTENFVELNGLLYFQAFDFNAAQTHKVYVTDGSPAGTRVVDLPTGVGIKSFTWWPFFAYKDELVTLMDDPWPELYGLNATSARRITFFNDNARLRHARELNGNIIFFTRGDEAQLWSSDGSWENTNSIFSSSEEDFEPGWWLEFGNKLFFTKRSTFESQRFSNIFVTDGTAEGSELFLDIFPHVNPRFFTQVGENRFYFLADTVQGTDLWVSDGTSKGTKVQPVAWPNGVSGFGSVTDIWFRGEYKGNMAALGSQLIFAANNGTTGTELWSIETMSNSTQATQEPAPVSTIETGSPETTEVPVSAPTSTPTPPEEAVSPTSSPVTTSSLVPTQVASSTPSTLVTTQSPTSRSSSPTSSPISTENTVSGTTSSATSLVYGSLMIMLLILF